MCEGVWACFSVSTGKMFRGCRSWEVAPLQSSTWQRILWTSSSSSLCTKAVPPPFKATVRAHVHNVLCLGCRVRLRLIRIDPAFAPFWYVHGYLWCIVVSDPSIPRFTKQTTSFGESECER